MILNRRMHKNIWKLKNMIKTRGKKDEHFTLGEILQVLKDGIRCGIYCEQNGLDYVYFDPAFIYQITEKKAVRSYRFSYPDESNNIFEKYKKMAKNKK